MARKVKIVLAANRMAYERFLKYYQLSPVEYSFASNKDSLMGLNHLNSQLILTDGYVANPCFASDRYLFIKNLADKEGIKDFITRKLVHQRV